MTEPTAPIEPTAPTEPAARSDRGLVWIFVLSGVCGLLVIALAGLIVLSVRADAAHEQAVRNQLSQIESLNRELADLQERIAQGEAEMLEQFTEGFFSEQGDRACVAAVRDFLERHAQDSSVRPDFAETCAGNPLPPFN